VIAHPPTSRSSRSSVTTTAKFLAAIRRSGVLTGYQFAKVKAQVETGSYPQELSRLARRLIREEVLTEYQARHLLHNDNPGLVLGRYVVLDRLGRGSMGRIYKARHQFLGRIVALKVIDPEVAGTPTAVARFRREMLLLGGLDHPNIVRALDADQVGHNPFIAMEYLSGEGLDRLLARGPISPGKTLEYAVQVAQALAHAHSHGVVHRDIKPSNLMICDGGRLKILDFGIGAIMARWGEGTGRKLTSDGLSIGTVEYMSPEQAKGVTLDGRSDLYSLGCVMYHLLSGRIPFLADSKLSSLAMRVGGQPDSIAELCPDLSPGLVKVVERLMASRPEDRYTDASEAAGAMLELLGNVTSQA
jgi:eukaryotic-like serine/threonine-protein kinase